MREWLKCHSKHSGLVLLFIVLSLPLDYVFVEGKDHALFSSLSPARSGVDAW